MKLTRDDITTRFYNWLEAWNHHDLRSVMAFIHDDIVFQSWSGKNIDGKIFLEKSWAPWFHHHENFFFTVEDFFIDEIQQKMMFSWKLEWPSPEKKYLGANEKRRGVDILWLKDGRIIQKNTYSKTTVEIDSRSIQMNAV